MMMVTLKMIWTEPDCIKTTKTKTTDNQCRWDNSKEMPTVTLRWHFCGCVALSLLHYDDTTNLGSMNCLVAAFQNWPFAVVEFWMALFFLWTSLFHTAFIECAWATDRQSSVCPSSILRWWGGRICALYTVSFYAINKNKILSDYKIWFLRSDSEIFVPLHLWICWGYILNICRFLSWSLRNSEDFIPQKNCSGKNALKQFLSGRSLLIRYFGLAVFIGENRRALPSLRISRGLCGT